MKERGLQKLKMTMASDTTKMSADEFVRCLEAKYLSTRSPTPPAAILRMLNRAVKLGLKDPKLLARAVSPLASADVFREKLNAIIASLPADAANELPQIPITCLPMVRSPNAVAALTPRGDPYILIDLNFTVCISGMVKILTHCARIRERTSDDTPVSRNRLRVALRDMADFVGSGKPTDLPNIPSRSDPSMVMFQSELVHGIDTFVVWHELCHHLLGHVRKIKEACHSSIPELDGRIISYSQIEEFQADLIGVRFCLSTLEHYKDTKKAIASNVPPTSGSELYAAPDIFCTILDVWEKLLGRRWSPLDTHPLAASRRAAIRSECSKNLPKTVTEFAVGVEQIFADLMR